MIRGTTPQLEFTLPIEAVTLSEGYISFAQEGRLLFSKSLADCAASGNVLLLRLSQEETLRFRSGRTVEIQIRAKTVTGRAIASEIIEESADRILKDGVI